VIWVQLDEEAFAFEAEFAYLGPGEGVDLGLALEHQDPTMGDRQVQRYVLMVLQNTWH